MKLICERDTVTITGTYAEIAPLLVRAMRGASEELGLPSHALMIADAEKCLESYCRMYDQMTQAQAGSEEDTPM